MENQQEHEERNVGICRPCCEKEAETRERISSTNAWHSPLRHSRQKGYAEIRSDIVGRKVQNRCADEKPFCCLSQFSSCTSVPSPRSPENGLISISTPPAPQEDTVWPETLPWVRFENQFHMSTQITSIFETNSTLLTRSLVF